MNLKALTIACGVALSVWGSTSIANAQDADPFVRLVAVGAAWEQEGYGLTHEARLRRLYEGQTGSYTLTLTAGVSYRIVGVCDRDCRDLDLGLFDELGNLVAVDVALGSWPVVMVTPRWTGPFVLKVEMASCGVGPCSVGIGVFGRGGMY